MRRGTYLVIALVVDLLIVAYDYLAVAFNSWLLRELMIVVNLAIRIPAVDAELCDVAVRRPPHDSNPQNTDLLLRRCSRVSTNPVKLLRLRRYSEQQ